MIWITSDSAWDMPKELYKENGFASIPTGIILGDKAYMDGVDITNEDIYAYAEKTGKTPKTAATSPMLYKEFFEGLTTDGSQVVHVALSAGISASCNNAKEAAKEVKGVYVVDGKSLSTGTALLAFYARDLRESGVSAEEIAKKVEERTDKVQCSFVVDTLDFLHKGGRCSGVARFASTLLKIKPTITMMGTMSVTKKYMGLGYKNAVSRYVDDTFARCPDPDLKNVFITYTKTDSEILEGVKRQVQSKFKFENIYFAEAQSTITSHCGKNTLGVLFLNK